jgi:hypothetical protein
LKWRPVQQRAPHIANAVEWLVGPTRRIFCDATHQSLEGVMVEDTGNVAARNSGVLVNCALNQFQSPNEMPKQIHCGGGSVKIEGHAQRFGVFCRATDAWEWHQRRVTLRFVLLRITASPCRRVPRV